MKRAAISVIVGILSVGVAAAQSTSEPAQQPNTASPGAAQEPVMLPAGAPIEAVLTKSLDSHKVKKGDPVIAEANESTEENGKTIIPRGAKPRGARDAGVGSFAGRQLLFAGHRV